MVTDFANRLLKNYRHYSKWARRQGISCYRIYDLDITQFPFCIDIYGPNVYMAEYHASHSMDENEHSEWLNSCILAVKEVLQVTEDKIYLKFRQRQKGLQQYEKFSRAQKIDWVEESGLKFKINLTDYLDAGLFLDHRQTRAMVKAESEGKKVLNLFCYTGSFSVYAASGGASRVDSVDLSNTYLSWAEENMKENGLYNSEKHKFIQADVKQWLWEDHPFKYDLIVLDPPTFSNSKRMKDVLDIQKDHVMLINASVFMLKPGGKLYFSTNYRGFQLEEASIKASSWKEISSQTVPSDFRNKQIHRCFIFIK
jgi:23S rRNA (cytosine1962-C5)-methyltransferase